MEACAAALMIRPEVKCWAKRPEVPGSGVFTGFRVSLRA